MGCWYERGRVALGIGSLAEALAYLQRVEEQAPETRNVQYMLGRAHASLGNTEDAQRYFQECASRDGQ